MRSLQVLLLAIIVGIAALAIGCGGNGDAPEPESSAPAEGSAPSSESAAGTEPAEAAASEEAPPARSAPPRRRSRTPRARPVRGVANIQILAPETRVEGDEVISTVHIRNVSRGSITRLTVSEFWYDEEGNATPGTSRTHRSPLQPNEIIEIELRTRKNERFYQNQFEFSHANGEVKAMVVEAFPKPEES